MHAAAPHTSSHRKYATNAVDRNLSAWRAFRADHVTCCPLQVLGRKPCLTPSLPLPPLLQVLGRKPSLSPLTPPSLPPLQVLGRKPSSPLPPYEKST